MPSKTRAPRATITVGVPRIENPQDITADDQERLDEIGRAHESSRPSNTEKAYRKAQEEWNSWCLARALGRGEKPLEEFSETERALGYTKR